MSRRALSLAVLAALALVQLGSLGWTIAQRELVLARGERYLFRCAPVDPYDAFRGRYVELSGEDLQHTVVEPERFHRGQKVYAPLTVDADGFAHLGTVSEKPPPQGAWVEARVDHVESTMVRIQPPFSRFYMEEKLAPKAEAAVRRNLPTTEKPEESKVWISVKIRKGIGVIEDLYVEGKPILEYLEGGSR